MGLTKRFSVLSVVVITLLLCCFGQQGNIASAYDAWQPEASEGDAAVNELKEILAEFTEIYNLAKTNKAANPVFLADLEKVLEQLKANSVIIERQLTTGRKPEEQAKGPGWYYIGRKFHLSSVDVTLVGGRASGVIGSSTKIIDYSEAKETENSLEAKAWRTYDNGDFIASSSLLVTWSDLPTFIGAEDQPIFNIRASGKGEGSWGPLRAEFVFSHAKEKGQPSTRSGAPAFLTTSGDNHFDNYTGRLQLEKKAGGLINRSWDRAIEVYLNGNILTFYYEWKD